MEVALADVSEALDAIEAGMGGRDPEEAAAAAARLPSHAALLRRNLDLFVGASCCDAQEKYLDAKRRHAALRARAMQLRRQHEIGSRVARGYQIDDAHDAAGCGFGTGGVRARAKLGRSTLLALTARDQAHLELLFREGLGIDGIERERSGGTMVSNRSASARQEHSASMRRSRAECWCAIGPCPCACVGRILSAGRGHIRQERRELPRRRWWWWWWWRWPSEGLRRRG